MIRSALAVNSSRAALSFGLVIALTSCKQLAAQDRLEPVPLALESDLFGSSLARLDDVDGDGVADLVVGSSRRDTKPGSVWVLSGKDLTVLAGIAEPRDAPSGFGVAVAGLPDVDGDGVPDVAIGATSRATGWNGVVYLWSVRTGDLFAKLAPAADSPWRTPGFGSALAVGRDEQRCVLAIGAASPRGTGGVWVYEIPSLQLVFQAQPAGAGPSFGTALSFGPVVEGDRQLLVGSPHDGEGGRVYVLAARTGELLRSLHGENDDELGAAIEEVGDVDGDGSSDMAIGAPGRANGGCVRIYSVPEWRLFHEHKIQPDLEDWHFVWGEAEGACFGFRIAAAGDLDQDGRADFLVSAPSGDVGDRAGFGWVTALSGASGEVILVSDWRFAELSELQSDLSDAGWSLCYLGDTDKDGLGDFAFGAPDPIDGGGVQLVSSVTRAWRRKPAFAEILAQRQQPSAGRLGGFGERSGAR